MLVYDPFQVLYDGNHSGPNKIDKKNIYEMDPGLLCQVIPRKIQVYGMDLPPSFYGMEVPT